MTTIDQLRKGITLAEEQGMTVEIGRGIAGVAGDALRAGQIEAAQEILLGLAVSNPYDAATWAMLAVVERRLRRLRAARVCAGIACHLAPADEQVRLVRAEVLLRFPEDRPAAIAELRVLAGAPGPVGARAAALVAALGAAVGGETISNPSERGTMLRRTRSGDP